MSRRRSKRSTIHSTTIMGRQSPLSPIVGALSNSNCDLVFVVDETCNCTISMKNGNETIKVVYTTVSVAYWQ